MSHISSGSVVQLGRDGAVNVLSGAADILVVPNLEAGNFLFKQMVYFMSATAAGIVMGAKVPVGTWDGQVTLTVPAGAQSGQKLRLRGKGLPLRQGGDGRGDLLVHLKTIVPKQLSDREKEIFEMLAKESKFNPRDEQ